MLSSGRKLQGQHLRVGVGAAAPQAPDLLVPRDSVASPHAHPGRPRRPPVRKGPAADRPPFPHTRGRPFGPLPSADPSPTRRLPIMAAPDALHPPGSQARCPGQGAASSSSAPRKAASMASKEGSAAEPAGARPPSCSDSAAPWQREGAGSAAGGAAASRGRRGGERRQAAGAAGRSHPPAGLPHVLFLLLTVAIAQLKAGSTKTAQTRLSLSPNSRQTTSATGLFIYCQHSDIPRQPCSSPVKTSVIVPISSHI